MNMKIEPPFNGISAFSVASLTMKLTFIARYFMSFFDFLTVELRVAFGTTNILSFALSPPTVMASWTFNVRDFSTTERALHLDQRGLLCGLRLKHLLLDSKT
jgi:hypothetical protein